MRMHVLYDANGRILAAVELVDGASEDAPQVRPVATPDQYTADLDLPEALAHLNFGDACQKLMVDVAQKVPCLRART